jgi:hypothetical protein
MIRLTIRKQNWKYTGSDPDPEFDLGGDNPPWTKMLDEFYVRDLSGKELAIYSDTTLSQWNVFGLDNVGKINSDNKRYYYMKDHLGSTRATINSTNIVISADDYDCWGYPLENRAYQSGPSVNQRYKFTK